MGKILEVQNLTKKYKIERVDKELTALEDVSFSVEKGEIVGIIGKSGAGKTTLLRILRGVEEFDAGRVRVEDVIVEPGSPKSNLSALQKKTAIHLQRSFALWPESILNNITRRLMKEETGFEQLPRDPYSERYKRIYKKAIEILDIVGLTEKKHYYYNILSGGEKQCVLLARQIAANPSVLLLDEPATMIDPKGRDKMLNAVKRINERMGTTVLFVSHMPEIHRKMADRVIWIDRGRKVKEGEPEEIIEEFMSEMEPPLELTTPKDVDKIRISNLWKRYRIYSDNQYAETIRMKNLNFSIKEGEILAIIGPCAAGKTVLIRLLSGIEPAQLGSVLYRVDGDKWTDICEYGEDAIKARLKISVLHQEFSLTYYESVARLFEFKLGLKSLDTFLEAKRRAAEMGIDTKKLDFLYRIADLPEEEAKEALKEIGLDMRILRELFPSLSGEEVRRRARPILEMVNLPISILDRYVYELSIGEQIRVALALKMTENPEVLLLDEPFGDLDPISLRKCINAVKSINRRGVTVILVSHQLEAVKEIAHRAILIHRGDIKMIGDPEEVCKEFIEKGYAAFGEG
ncbi:MAG: ATP-binding cassette domain-containing protein [Candidatus Methanospirareceae archaeon]